MLTHLRSLAHRIRIVALAFIEIDMHELHYWKANLSLAISDEIASVAVVVNCCTTEKKQARRRGVRKSQSNNKCTFWANEHDTANARVEALPKCTHQRIPFGRGDGAISCYFCVRFIFVYCIFAL